MEVMSEKCFGEVLERYENIYRTVTIFYCYKCKKVHEIIEEDDWLNGVTITKMR
jgi:hypothetical protein